MPEQNGKIEHPWMAIARQMDPQPAPIIVKWDIIEMQQNDGTLVDVALMTVANPGSVVTAFFAGPDLENLIKNAQETREKMQDKKLAVATSMPDAPIDLGKFRRQ